NPASPTGANLAAASAPYQNNCPKPTSTPPPPCAAVGDGKDPLAALLASPSGIVVDANNNIIFNDRNNARIRMLLANGTTAGNGQSNGYGAITTIVGCGNNNAANGNCTTGNTGDGNLGKFATVGNNGITGLALDANGKLYFTDRVNNRVRVFDTVSGIIGGFAGASTFNGDATCLKAMLNSPTGLAMHSLGNIY